VQNRRRIICQCLFSVAGKFITPSPCTAACNAVNIVRGEKVAEIVAATVAATVIPLFIQYVFFHFGGLIVWINELR